MKVFALLLVLSVAAYANAEDCDVNAALDCGSNYASCLGSTDPDFCDCIDNLFKCYSDSNCLCANEQAMDEYCDLLGDTLDCGDICHYDFNDNCDFTSGSDIDIQGWVQMVMQYTAPSYNRQNFITAILEILSIEPWQLVIESNNVQKRADENLEVEFRLLAANQGDANELGDKLTNVVDDEPEQFADYDITPSSIETTDAGASSTLVAFMGLTIAALAVALLF